MHQPLLISKLQETKTGSRNRISAFHNHNCIDKNQLPSTNKYQFNNHAWKCL